MSKIISNSLVSDWSGRDCSLRCLDIIDFCSPLNEEEIANKLNDKVTLGELDISASKCDRCVRELINRKIRVPSGKPKLPRGSIGTSTKVSKLISDSCK